MMMIHHSKPYITDLDQKAVRSQMDSGMLAEGGTTELFEKKVSEYLNIKYCLATSSGVTALHLAFSALQLKSEDEVIIPSYVCDSVYKAIENFGAKPVLCDIGSAWNMTPETVNTVFTKRTKAIVLVHIFGINAWNEEFRKFNVPVIEDNCQAFGLEVSGKKQELKGDIAVYSFHTTKCLATGEGGMFATNNHFYFDIALKKKNNHQPFCRMTDLQSALGISQLQQYGHMKKRRREIAERYLKNLPSVLLINTNKIKSNSMYFRFPLTINSVSIDECIMYFMERNIAVRRGVDAVLHKIYGLAGDFKNTEQTFNTTLSIPIYPALSDAEVNTIIEEVNKFYNGRNR